MHRACRVRISPGVEHLGDVEGIQRGVAHEEMETSILLVMLR